jgi:glycosyltransferase involved in cell wall biosynthesis
MNLKYKVAICQPRLLHYRTALFEQLKDACAADDIDIHLVCGQPVGRERSKQDEANLPWVTRVENRYVDVAGRTILWQPFPANLRQCNLVIVMQESRIISNYPLQTFRKMRGFKVAYWGHGKNFFNKAPGGITDWWKNWLLRRVDWWFAYTEIVVDIVKESGFPAHKITCLNNAIDTSGFKSDLNSVTEHDLARCRAQLGIADNAPVGIFCGSLYPDKKLDFLIESVDRIYHEASNFNLIVIGQGPSASLIESASASRPWIHFVGQRRGLEKALYFRLADFMLNPGTVGLHIVDAFCAGLIMITTFGAHHSPEIAYLRNGQNGLMVDATANSYAKAVLSLIDDPDETASLRQEALIDSDVYTLPKMVDSFHEGICRALVTET